MREDILASVNTSFAREAVNYFLELFGPTSVGNEQYAIEHDDGVVEVGYVTKAGVFESSLFHKDTEAGQLRFNDFVERLPPEATVHRGSFEKEDCFIRGRYSVPIGMGAAS